MVWCYRSFDRRMALRKGSCQEKQYCLTYTRSFHAYNTALTAARDISLCHANMQPVSSLRLNESFKPTQRLLSHARRISDRVKIGC